MNLGDGNADFVEPRHQEENKKLLSVVVKSGSVPYSLFFSPRWGSRNVLPVNREKTTLIKSIIQ